MSYVPGDQPARDSIAQDLDRTLFVEAGAGTGKTTALVDRVAALVEQGHARIGQVAAITFTEPAAAELRDRVLVRFERDEQNANLDPGTRARAREARFELDEAAIETIHGFASRLLSVHPLEAGLPPGFAVRDQVDADIAFDERWREHLDAMLDDDALAEALLRAFAIGVRVDDLRGLAAALHADWDRAAGWLGEQPHAPVEHPDVAEGAREVARGLLEVCALTGECSDAGDGMVAHLGRLAPLAERLARAAEADHLEALRLLRGFGTSSKRVGNQRNWRGATSVAAVRDALAEIDEQRAALLEQTVDTVIADLGASLAGFAQAYAEERRRAGALEFHDMLVRARDLLRDRPDVRASLRERFPFLLIDEFQDTDPLQTEIAFLLAAPLASEAGGWRDVTPEAGRLFFVGDPKQSIYRFRRADIGLYQEVQKRCAGADPTRLTENFRSLPGVIRYVNALFRELMPDASLAGQPAYVDLHAARAERDGAVSVRLLGEPMPGASADQVRRQEAAEIARAIRAARAREWPVYERIEGVERSRPARYSDVAILVPRRTGLEILEEALEQAEIPYRLVSRSLIYDTAEVRDLLIVLRAIDDPTDQVALVAALRSPAFGCGDDDLFTYVDAGARWDYRRDLPEALDAAHPVAEGMRWLRMVHEERWWMPVSALVERVVRERRLLELAYVDRRPRERWQRLRFIADQARAFEDGGGTGLRRFLEWTDRQAQDRAMINESVVPERDDDAVRVMTIHASKGLQFPIVAVTGFDNRRRRTPPALLWEAGGEPRIRLRGGVEQSGYAALNNAEKALDDLEEVRLLYVALTRACDHLLVGAHHLPTRSDESLAATMHRVALAHPELCTAVEPGDDARDEPTPPPPALLTAEDRAAWIAEREQAVAAHRRVRARSATELARELSAHDGPEAGVLDDPNLAKEEPREEEPPWKRGRGGTEFGRAVHSVLQVIDLESGADLEAFAAAQAVAEGIPERQAEVAATVRRALASDVVREAVASGRYWREVYIGAPVEGVVVEGFIDLLYETDQGYVVVDFKTDSLPGPSEIDAAAARYRPQLAAYALALAEHLDRPVARAMLLFLGAGQAVPRPIDALHEAMAELRERVPAL